MEHAHFKFGVPDGILPVFATDADKNEIFYDEEFPVYLADKKHFNAGGALDILKSPKHYIYGITGVGDDSDEAIEEPDYFRFGRAIHMAVLEPEKFRRLWIVEPEFTGLTKEGKESAQSGEARAKRKAWREDQDPGAMIITEKELGILHEMIECLMEHPQAANFFRNGRPEVTGRFTHPKYKLRCKIRPDYITFMPDGSYYFFDLKSARDASASLFATDVARLKYHVKMAFYWDGLTAIFGRPPEACALVPVEKKIPSKAEVFWLNEEDLQKGRTQNEYAMESLIRCMRENKWPRRKAWAQMLMLPTWTNSEPLPEFEWGDDVKTEEPEADGDYRTAEDEAARELQRGGPSGGDGAL